MNSISTKDGGYFAPLSLSSTTHSFKFIFWHVSVPSGIALHHRTAALLVMLKRPSVAQMFVFWSTMLVLWRIGIRIVVQNIHHLSLKYCSYRFAHPAPPAAAGDAPSPLQWTYLWDAEPTLENFNLLSKRFTLLWTWPAKLTIITIRKYLRKCLLRELISPIECVLMTLFEPSLSSKYLLRDQRHPFSNR